MSEIIPGILEKDWASIEIKIKQVLPFAKTIQIDIIDGIFAPNTTFLDPKPFKTYTDKLFFEVQMLVDNPLKYVESYANAGFKRFIGQIEKMPDQKAFIDEARKYGEAGLAIDIDTSIDEIKVDFNLPDCFTLMSVKAGFSGQIFQSVVLGKIKQLKKKTKKPIEIDGGVNKTNIDKLKALGIERYIVNSGLFGAENILKAYQELEDMIS